jgi:hypothetical protein
VNDDAEKMTWRQGSAKGLWKREWRPLDKEKPILKMFSASSAVIYFDAAQIV